MSSSSNASSNTRSSQSNKNKALIASAMRDYKLLQTDQDCKRFLVENSYLFARDK